MRINSFLLLLLLPMVFGCSTDSSNCELVREKTEVPKHVHHLHKALQQETSNTLELIELQDCSSQYKELEKKYNMEQVTAIFTIANKERKSTVANLLIFRSPHEAKKEFRHLTEQLTYSDAEMTAKGIKIDKKAYFSSERYKPGEFIFRYKNGIYQLPTTCSVSNENWRIFLIDVTSTALESNVNLPYLYIPCGTSYYSLEKIPKTMMRKKN